MRPHPRSWTIGTILAPLAVCAAATAWAAGNGATKTTAAATNTTAPADLAEQARRIIAQLSDDRFQVRQRASLRVNNLSGRSLPLIEAALRAPDLDLEARLRLETALHFVKPRARFEAERDARRAWLGRQFHDAYDRFGHRSPKWDADAHRAIDQFLSLGYDPTEATQAARDAAVAALGAVLDKGCDDPLIHALEHVATVTPNGGHPSTVPAWRSGQTTPSTWDSVVAREAPYPPAIKFLVTLGNARADVRVSQVDPCSQFFPAIAREPGLPAGLLAGFADTYLDANQREGQYLSAGHLSSLLQKCGDPYAKVFDARVRLVSVLQQRQQDPTAGQEELVAADKLLREAWDADPSDPRAPTLLLAVGRARGATLAESQEWYVRAMDADPDRYRAARQMLECVHARGDAQGVLSFARARLATHNWRGGMPYILIDAHRLLAEDSPNRADYFKDPGVWRDVREVYEGRLLNFPDDVSARSNFAHLAAQCDQWDVAHAQFQILGDTPDLRPFVSKSSYDYFRRKAARLSATQPAATRPMIEPATP